MSLEQALAVVKAAGYRVSKPRAPKTKTGVGPTFVVGFADGEVTRMSIFTSRQNLDVARGVRLSRHAWASRKKSDVAFAPPIQTATFEEQDGSIILKCSAEARKIESLLAA